MSEDIKIIPIGICWQHPDTSLEIAQKILKAENETGRKICIIASSDFSHYVDPQSGFQSDQIVLDGILDFDPNAVYDHIIKDKISVCGYGPIMSLMYYANLKEEKTSAEVLVRGHSGEVYPAEKVVDYVSVLFYYE
jgi:AmmeMemoRadiSam system protein B